MRFVKLIVAVGVLAGVAVIAYEQRETRREVARLAARLDAPAAAQPAASPAPVTTDLPGDYVLEAPDVVELRFADPAGEAAKRFSGEKLIRPDGTISLGSMGDVVVAGLTIAQAEDQVRRPFGGTEVRLLVRAFNSKFYYLIDDRGGERVRRQPLTGNETVLDALSAGHVLADGAGSVWLARRKTGGEEQVLPVDYRGIVRHGQTATNYQLMANDRLYVRAAGPNR